jgi:hypothetical protein
MTAASLFNQLKAGKISKEQFLYEVRRDQNLPFISPITTFKEAIKILQNRGIVTEVFEMGSMEEDNDTLTKGAYRADKLGSDVVGEGAQQCQCGGSYEPHEDAGEMVCASCGEREPISENGGDEEEYDPFYDREEEINYGIDDEDREVEDDMEGNREEDYVGEGVCPHCGQEPCTCSEHGGDELEDIIAKQDAEKQGQEDVLAQFDMGEGEELSLREQVQEFVKNAMKGGSSMDEAKDAAREYFNKKETLNEAAKPKLTADQVNPYELRKGIEIEMGYAQKAAPSWTEASLMNIAGDYSKAQAKALKNLAKDPAYYSNQIAGKHKEKKAPAVKADGYVKAPKSKMEKSNVKTTLSKTERAKGNPQGVKLMKEDKFGKIREYVKAQLKKEAQLVKSATTGATIDVLPDAQAQKAKAELQKKGVKTTSVAV